MSTNLEELIYPDEPSVFINNDIAAFIIWSTKQGTSDVTIQNEDKIVCEIHGKKIRVTNHKLSKAELINIIGDIYKSDGAISRLNSCEDIDLPWIVKVDRNETLRFRVNITTIFIEGHTGYSITIRTIPNRPQLLETLNLPQDIVDNLIHREGLIIIVGATGSGKSTLLASILDWRMRQVNANLKILTYESPIEFVYDEVEKPSSIISQTEIGVHLKTFADGVRNALRRKPNIILIGELRDRETIGESITASQTGHLVYGTLHATGVASTVRRMLNAFDAKEKNSRGADILSSLKLIVAQKLIPSLDGKRVAIREYLAFTQQIRSILSEKDMDNLTYEVNAMLNLHGKTFIQDAQEKFNEGLISEEILNEVIFDIVGTKKLEEKDELEEVEEMKITTKLTKLEKALEKKELIDKEIKSLKKKNKIIENVEWKDL